jgi:hypothetical protein
MRRLGGPESRSGHCVNRKVYALNVNGADSSVVQPVALSLYCLSYQVDFKAERRELESAGSGLDPSVGSCEHGNEYSISINGGRISGIAEKLFFFMEKYAVWN